MKRPVQNKVQLVGIGRGSQIPRNAWRNREVGQEEPHAHRKRRGREETSRTVARPTRRQRCVTMRPLLRWRV